VLMFPGGLLVHQPYAAIFINCGGTEDLVRLLGAGPHARLFVIDCHRPVHLANIQRDNHKVSHPPCDGTTVTYYCKVTRSSRRGC